MDVELPVGDRPILVYAYWMLVGAALTILIMDFAGLIKKGPCDCDDRDTANTLDRTIEFNPQIPQAHGATGNGQSPNGFAGDSESPFGGLQPVSSTGSESGN